MTTRKMMTALALVLSMATQQAVAGEWHYTDTDNKIGERVLVAFVTATNQINLDAPYAGSQNPILVIRSTDNWLDVSVKIGKGQILCDTYSHTKIRVRFDAGKPITVGCERPSDGDSTMVFLGNVTRLVGAIKSAKKMVVEIVLYQNGNQYAEFDVSEFIYDKLGIPAAKKTVAKRAPAELGYVCEGGVRCAVSDVK